MQFCPSVYEHAARLIDLSPWQVSRDIQLLTAAHIRAFELYEHSPVVVGIDIYNLEPQAYGAVIDEPSDSAIPAIRHAACKNLSELANIEPLNPATDGRIPMVIQAAKQIAERLPRADVRVPVSGPFSIAANLLGCESLLYEVATDPDSVKQALHHLVIGQTRFCREIVRNGLDIAFFESAAAPPLLSPESFQRVEFEPLTECINQAANVVGHQVPCVIGGDTFPILDHMLRTGTGYLICPFETDQPKFMIRMKQFPNVMVRINMDLRVLVADEFDNIKREIDRVCALAADREKVCIGTGALPYEADPENILNAAKYLDQKLPPPR